MTLAAQANLANRLKTIEPPVGWLFLLGFTPEPTHSTRNERNSRQLTGTHVANQLYHLKK
jgi:hypothetical protein